MPIFTDNTIVGKKGSFKIFILAIILARYLGKKGAMDGRAGLCVCVCVGSPFSVKDFFWVVFRQLLGWGGIAFFWWMDGWMDGSTTCNE
jgi:hypothetical protein